MSLKESKFVHRILRIQPPMVVFWFPWYWQRTEIGRIRRILGWIAWREETRLRSRAIFLIKLILWPLIAILATVFGLWIKGADPWRLARKSRFTQLKELIYFGFWKGLAAEQYYTLRIYLFSADDVVDDFLTGNEIKHMNRVLGSSSGAELVNCKWKLERHLQRLGIPVVSNLAVFGEMEVAVADQGITLPEKSLYFKPVDGFRGRGIEHWSYRPESGKWEREDLSLSEQQLLNYFEVTAQQEPYILQETLRNHESLAPLSWGGLMTLRVMTVFDRKEAPEVVGVHLLMPRRGAVVNHGSNGGLNAKVDISTKRLLWCFSHFPRETKLDVHPDTGTSFEGFEIDLLDQVMALAIEAHRTIPDVFSIGWDMVLTDSGIRILEGNTQWGIETGMWFGRTVLPRRFLELWDERERADQADKPLSS